MEFSGKKTLILLALIIFLAAFLRFSHLGSVPPGLTNDEANIGYDAYSVLKTGKDQWGNFLPLTSFKGFGDYRPSLYTYLTIPSIALFGLDAFAVRFSSALFGVLTVSAAFFLVKQLFKSSALGLLAALFLAVNPWHIGMSRVGIESNLAVFLVTMGVLFFVLAQKNPKLFFFSFLFFSLSIYAYTANLLFTPFLVFVLILIYRPFNFKTKKNFLAALVFALIVLAPFVFSFKLGSGATRSKQVNLGTDVGLQNRINEKRGECQKNWNATFCRLVLNKGAVFSFTFLENYARHFSPELLLVNGSSTQYSVLPPRGLLFLFEFFLFPFGVWFIFRRKDTASLLLISWIFLAPVADSLTGAGHYSRAMVVLPSLQIVESYGFYQLIKIIKFKKILVSAVLFVGLFEMTSFLTEYYAYYPNFYSRSSDYGYKELFTYLGGMKNDYDRVIVSNMVDRTKQYIFYLFYTAYDPLKFQTSDKVVKTQEKGGWIEVRRLDNFYFVSALPGRKELLEMKGRTLLVATPEEFPEGFVPKYEFKDLKGDPLFEVIDVDSNRRLFEERS